MNEPSGQAPGALSRLRVLAVACVAAMLWLPWAWSGAAGAINAAGCVAAFVVLGPLAAANAGFGAARKWLAGAAVLFLIDAVYGLAFGSLNLFYVHGHAVKMPITVRLGDFVLGAAIWTIAGALIELASAGRNIDLRNSIASRRDLYLMFLVAEGVVTGPVMALAYRQTGIDWNLLQLALGFVAIFKLIVMLLWALLLVRCSKGFESDDILL